MTTLRTAVLLLAGASSSASSARGGRALGAAHLRGTRAVAVHASQRPPGGVLDGADPEQVRLMEERVILVDRDDRVIGDESKVNSHLNDFGPMLHRAFSVFLFDDAGRLLLQRRALTKVTFPGYWTNTCCSHPLHVPSELGTGDGGLLDGAVAGAARAAIRKMEHELGVPLDTFQPEELTFLTRIHYLARARTDAGTTGERPEFGEHEIDYLFFVRAPPTGVPLAANPNEVCDTRFVSQAELREMLAAARSGDLQLTPWFELIAEDLLFRWWADLDDEAALLRHRQVERIRRYGECEQEEVGRAA